MAIMKCKLHLYFFSVLLVLSSSSSIADNTTIPSYPTEPGPKTFNQGTLKQFKNSYKDAVIYSFNGNEKFHSSRLQRSYFTKKIEVFYGDFLIGNYTPVDIDFKLYFFIDYKQSVFSISNKNPSQLPIHKVTVKAESELILPLSLGKIAEGAHDILIIAIRDEPENRYRNSKMISHRANLYVKNGTFNNIEFTKLANPVQSKIINIVINKNPDKLEPLSKLVNTKHDKYFIHVNNFYRTNSKYSLLVLLNSKQISIDGKKKVIYFKQQKLSSNVIPIEINTESKKSTDRDNELLAIVIDNPFSVLEPNRGVYSNIHSNVRISNKIIN